MRLYWIRGKNPGRITPRGVFRIRGDITNTFHLCLFRVWRLVIGREF